MVRNFLTRVRIMSQLIYSPQQLLVVVAFLVYDWLPRARGQQRLTRVFTVDEGAIILRPHLLVGVVLRLVFFVLLVGDLVVEVGEIVLGQLATLIQAGAIELVLN